MKSIPYLNEKYAPLSPEERIATLYQDFPEVLVTSSFGINSAFLLHLYHRVNPEQPIHFINTGYLFEETLLYKERIAWLYGLHIVEIQPDDFQHQYTKDYKVWERDPDFCCAVNKVDPLDQVKADFPVYVSGLMRHQNAHRKGLQLFEAKANGIAFYPILDVKPEERETYRRKHHLPTHPLQPKGYGSVGCKHCTLAGKGREGRWKGLSKMECGLHL